MFNGKYISVDRIIERFYTDYGFQDQVDWMNFIEWISDCMGIMGVPVGYIDKTAKIEIVEHLGELPCDYFMYSGIRTYETKVPLRENTDVYYNTSNENVSVNDSINIDSTFTINNNYIHTSIESGYVEMSYKAVNTDDRGYPMIPDDDKVIRMLISYVAWKTFAKMYYRNQIDERKLDRAEKEYLFNAGAARTKLLLPSMDRMESIKNAFLRLIPKINEHANAFKTLGQQEERYKQ